MIANPTSFAMRIKIGMAISAKITRNARPRKHAIECIADTSMLWYANIWQLVA
jgi:hypothetical protein